LQKVLIPILKPEVKERIEAVEELIKTEINVKEVEYVDDASGILVKNIKPNFRKLGQQYGPKMKTITGIINGFGKDEIAAIERDGNYEIEVDGEKINLERDDVEITSRDIPGWLVASEGGLTVALDITISDELRKEGLSRDMINRIQNLRKDQGLDVQDKIAIKYATSDEMMRAAIADFSGYIKAETQALSLELNGTNEGEKFDIDGIEIDIQIEVVK